MGEIKDAPLSLHFTLYELTKTSNAELQEENRNLTLDQVAKLALLADHCEAIRAVCGGHALRVHSGYRSPGLNGATVGSSSTSQHPKCEAVDFDIPGQALAETFALLMMAGKSGKFCFGQLILERAERSYGTSEWVHCSLIGSLPKEKIGQCLQMKSSPEDGGKQHYELVTQLNFDLPSPKEKEKTV